MEKLKCYRDCKWYKVYRFPYDIHNKSYKKYEAILGIGGNIGDTKRRFQKLFFFLKRDRFIDVIKTSAILKNPPFGYKNQDDFYNAVMKIKTNLTPKELLKRTQKIEKIFKRVREFKNSPRTLDIDIIFYDKISYKKDNLILPHPKWRERESVILPLKQIMKKSDFIQKEERYR